MLPQRSLFKELDDWKRNEKHLLRVAEEFEEFIEELPLKNSEKNRKSV